MSPRSELHNGNSSRYVRSALPAPYGVGAPIGLPRTALYCVALCAALLLSLAVGVFPYSANADELCHDCAGTGYLLGYAPCDVCGGDGDKDGQICTVCGGDGVRQVLNSCASCSGSGVAAPAAAPEPVSIDDGELTETIRHLENRVTAYQNFFIVLFGIYCGVMCALIFWGKVYRHD